MKATGFTRYGFTLGKRFITYDNAECEYRCEDCGGNITRRWTEVCREYPENWHAECAPCKSKHFIHKYQSRKQRGRAARIMTTLPQDVVQSYLANRKGD